MTFEQFACKNTDELLRATGGGARFFDAAAFELSAKPCWMDAGTWAVIYAETARICGWGEL